MKKQRTFKPGEPLDTLSQFVKTAADDLSGDVGSPVLVRSIRIVVETVGATLRGKELEAILEPFGLVDAADDVVEFLEYRRDERKKPVRTVDALRRLLKPFERKSFELRQAIAESMRNDWLGLFLREASPAKNRSMGDAEEGGASDGGLW